MDGVSQSPPDAPPTAVHRWAIDFAICGDTRFLSHLDVLRLFARAVGRARLPVRFSEGFNPRPRMSLPLPRPVGVASNVERLVLDLTEELTSAELLAGLGQQMPRGITLSTARLLDSRAQCVPLRVVYFLECTAEERPMLERRVSRLLDNDKLEVERVHPKQAKPRRVDIRPFVDSVEATSGGVRMCLTVSHEGTARPVEVCQALGLDANTVHHRILRTEIEWQ